VIIRWVRPITGSASTSLSAARIVSAAAADRDEMRTTLWLPASADSAHE
jgi:hypothetical protein